MDLIIIRELQKTMVLLHFNFSAFFTAVFYNLDKRILRRDYGYKQNNNKKLLE